MSHPFQGGVGDRYESSFSRRGGGTVMSDPKGGGAKEEAGYTNHSQGEGWGQMCPFKTQYLLERF